MYLLIYYNFQLKSNCQIEKPIFMNMLHTGEVILIISITKSLFLKLLLEWTMSKPAPSIGNHQTFHIKK
jgi:hypothetical protein